MDRKRRLVRYAARVPTSTAIAVAGLDLTGRVEWFTARVAVLRDNTFIIGGARLLVISEQ